MASVGDRIREERESRKWTQDQLADKSKISKGFLSEIENDKRNPSAENVLKIANSLGVSVDYLLRGDETVPRHRAPVIIPPKLAEAAEQLNLSYAETVELLEAHQSVIARRNSLRTKPFELQDWIDLHKAIKKLFG